MPCILIIEPTGFLSRMLAKPIKSHGLSVRSVSSVPEAIKRLPAIDPVLVLVDLEGSSKVPPLVAAARLVEAAAPRGALVYLVTSDVDGIEESVTRTKAHGHFRKPISPADFDAFLTEHAADFESEPQPEVVPSVRCGGHVCLLVVISADGNFTTELGRVLSADRYRVLSAPTVETGLRLVISERPCMVVADLDVQGSMKVEQAVSTIVRDSTMPPPAVVLLSSDLGTVDEVAARLGAAAFHGKPIQAGFFAAWLDGSTDIFDEVHRRRGDVVDVPADSPSRYRVLVVEPSGSLAAEMADELPDSRYQVVGARTQDEAVMAMTEVRADLVVFDAAMPCEPNLETVFSRLSRWDMHAVPTVILLSDFDCADELSKLLGACAYHMKPVTGAFIAAWVAARRDDRRGTMGGRER